MMTTRREFITKTVAGMLAPTVINPLHTLEAARQQDVFKSSSAKIHVFSKHFHWLSYEEMASVVADLGFDGIDLTVRPNGHVTPEKVTSELPKAINAIRKKGLVVEMITTAITNSKQQYSEQIIKTSADLGVKFYRMGWISYDQSKSIPENVDVFRKQFAELAALNERLRIHGAYQNHSGTSLGSSMWDLWLVLKDLDPDYIGCQYDIHHATVEGANSWPIGLKLLRNHIKTIDIKDFRWEESNGKWKIAGQPLGTGMVNFNEFFNTLKSFNIQCPISLHFEYPLGGAENGDTKLNISKERLMSAMEQDLKTVKSWI